MPIATIMKVAIPKPKMSNPERILFLFIKISLLCVLQREYSSIIAECQ
jgi:hypothetical protein